MDGPSAPPAEYTESNALLLPISSGGHGFVAAHLSELHVDPAPPSLHPLLQDAMLSFSAQVAGY